MFECTEIKDNKTSLIYSIKNIRISDTFNYSADTRYFIDLFCEITGYEYLNVELKRFWNKEQSRFDYLIDDFTRLQMPDNDTLDMSKLLGRPPYIEIHKERYIDSGVPTVHFEINPEQPTKRKERTYTNILEITEPNYCEMSIKLNALYTLLDNFTCYKHCDEPQKLLNNIDDVLFFTVEQLREINEIISNDENFYCMVEKEFIYKNKG